MKALAVGSGPNRLLRSALALIALAVSLVELHDLLVGYPWGVDVAIPLQAATRWLAGGQPYLASAFLAGPGYDAPFLYPPVLLPILAPLTHVPQLAVTGAWFVLSLGGAVFACRRLAIPWLVVPLFLAWPPFAEGLLGGNVQVLLFAAFVSLFWRAPAAASAAISFAPAENDLANPVRTGPLERLTTGLKAIAVGALKAAQVQPWLYLLRRDWRAAAMGAAALAALGLATLPLVGIGTWLDWLASSAGRTIRAGSWPAMESPVHCPGGPAISCCSDRWRWCSSCPIGTPGHGLGCWPWLACPGCGCSACSSPCPRCS